MQYILYGVPNSANSMPKVTTILNECQVVVNHISPGVGLGLIMEHAKKTS